MNRIVPIIVALSLAALAAGCARQGQAPPAGASAIRLVDLFTPESLSGTTQPAETSAEPAAGHTWLFASGDPRTLFPATGGCGAGAGVAALALKDARLTGRTTTDFPILDCPLELESGDTDSIHSIEIRMSSTAPGELALGFSSDKEPDFKEEIAQAREFEWRPKTPLIADGNAHTYTLEPQFPATLDRTKHLFVRPANAAGVEFAIESIRIVSRREHLARIRSGPGWQGLGEVYSESLVSRAPETLRFDVTLPERAWLDLSLGTLENHPLTFVVSASSGGGNETTLLRRTITRGLRWERSPVELAALAGKPVTLTLALEGAETGAIGLWGSPVIRESRRGDTDGEAGGGEARAPNVILVWTDTLRRDHLELYGHNRPTAPQIARLGAEGTVFDDCNGQATWTKVATPSLMTSLQPLTNGVRSFWDRLPASAVTMAEVFRDAGYSTLSFSSVLFVGKMTNLHQGFEELHEDGSLPDRKSSKSAREYVDRLLPWIEARRDSPFFAFLHVTDPHDPFRPYPPYDTLWADPARAAQHEKDAATVKKFIKDPLLRNFGMPSRDEVLAAGLDPDEYSKVDRDWYDGSIAGMDAEIGRMVERLRALGLDRNTLIVFTADHGEEFFEHGRSFHGQSVYSELQRLPLVFWWPGRLGAGRVGDTVSTMDILPTILELAGLDPPEGIQGTSLVPLLAPGSGPQGASLAHAGPAPAAHPAAFTEKAATASGQGSPPPYETESYSIVSGGWKLIHNVKAAEGTPEFELFERARDPLDAENVAPAHPDIVERLGKQIDEWRAAATAVKLKPDDEAASELKPEELERLKSLGYIQ